MFRLIKHQRSKSFGSNPQFPFNNNILTFLINNLPVIKKRNNITLGLYEKNRITNRKSLD